MKLSLKILGFLSCPPEPFRLKDTAELENSINSKRHQSNDIIPHIYMNKYVQKPVWASTQANQNTKQQIKYKSSITFWSFF